MRDVTIRLTEELQALVDDEAGDLLADTGPASRARPIDDRGSGGALIDRISSSSKRWMAES